MNNFFDNQRILYLIWKRKFHFVVVGIIAFILSAIFSGPAFITPKFKSMARIYPTNIWVASNESETEQMLEIVNSNDIKLRMINAFGLDTVYKIGKDDPQYLSLMLFLYDKNVKTEKTEYETVEIEVLDNNPQRASDMCDSIIQFYNEKVGDMYKIRYHEMVQIAKEGLKYRYNELDSIKGKLDSIREEYELLNIERQVPEVTRGYMTALAEGRGNAPDTKKIKKIYDNLSKEGTNALWLETRFEQLQVAIDTLTFRRDYYLDQYNKKTTYSNRVENPFPADKKSYPIRWLIVLFSTISATFLALLVFLVLDYRKID